MTTCTEMDLFCLVLSTKSFAVMSSLSFFVSLPSRAISHAHGHLRVSRVLLDGLRKRRLNSRILNGLLHEHAKSHFLEVLSKFSRYKRRLYMW